MKTIFGAVGGTFWDLVMIIFFILMTCMCYIDKEKLVADHCWGLLDLPKADASVVFMASNTPTLHFSASNTRAHLSLSSRRLACNGRADPGAVLPIMAHTGRFRLKGVPFSGFRYMKG